MPDHASSTAEGLTYLDIDPVVEEHPTAVGSNSPRVLKNLSLGYENSLETAVDELDATLATLLISVDTPVSDHLIVPENIQIKIQDRALIIVDEFVELTINSFVDPGSVKCFSGGGKTFLGRNAILEMNLSWWAGISESGDANLAFLQATQSLTNNYGGILRIPSGVWKTTSFSPPSGSIIVGAGSGVDESNASVLVLSDLESEECVVKVSENFRDISIRDLTISTDSSVSASCFIAEGTYPNSASGLELSNITFHGTGIGSQPQVYVKDLGDDWEAININFNHCTWITPEDGIGFKCDSANNSINFVQPFFYFGVGAEAMVIEHCGAISILNPTYNGISSEPAVATPNRTVIASVTTGQKGITLNSISSPTLFTLDDVGQRIVIEDALDSYITGILSATVATSENDATDSVADADMDISYLSPSDEMARCAIHITGGRGGGITVIGAQDEGLQYFLINDGSQLSRPVSLIGCIIQSTILLNESLTLNLIGNDLLSQTIVTGTSCAARIFSHGNYVKKIAVNLKPSNIGVELTHPRIFGVRAGEPHHQTGFDSLEGELRQTLRMPTEIKHANEFTSNPQSSIPVFGVGTVFDKLQLRIGRLSPVTEEFDYYYDLYRDYSTGRFKFNGNQSEPYKGVDFNADVNTSQRITSGVVVLTDGANIATNTKLGNTFKVTLAGNRTLDTPSNPIDGQVCRWIFKQDTMGSRTITLDSAFALGTDISSITLSTTANKRDVMEAIYDSSDSKWIIINFKKGY